MSASRAIINADDFGESTEITRGIAACIDAGRLTSTTILANMPDTEEALRWAAERGRTTSFGVHLNLCEGLPLTAARTLTGGDGRFHRKRVQALRALARRLDLADVEAELRAQIARVRDAGVDISHLDGHKHLHQLPGVGAVAAELARECGLERVRCTHEDRFWPRGIAPSAGLSRLLRRALARRFEPQLARRGLRWPARTLDLADVMRAPSRDERLELLRHPTGTMEIFCHPSEAGASPPDRRSASRAAECEFLLSDEFAGLLRDADVSLVSFWDL